jgi:hypothetical protein
VGDPSGGLHKSFVIWADCGKPWIVHNFHRDLGRIKVSDNPFVTLPTYPESPIKPTVSFGPPTPEAIARVARAISEELAGKLPGDIDCGVLARVAINALFS